MDGRGEEGQAEEEGEEVKPLDYGRPNSAYATKPARRTVIEYIGLVLWRMYLACVVLYISALIVGGTGFMFGWWTLD